MFGKLFLQLRKSPLARFLFIVAFFILLAAISFLVSVLKEKKPVIYSVTPPVGNPGDTIMITGENFGERDFYSFVEIGNSRPIDTAYSSWTDNTILVRVPEFTGGGLVYVNKKNQKSNPLLFTKASTIPVILKNTTDTIEPVINSISQKTASVGTVITIKGKRFGANRGGGKVFFQWAGSRQAQNVPVSRDSTQVPMIECSDRDFDYELWSDEEIRVKVPSGAVTGNIIVQTDRGNSNGAYIEIQTPGERVYTGQHTYAVAYGVDITNVTGGRDNSLYLRVPKPMDCLTQYVINGGDYTVKPFIENFDNRFLHRLENITSGKNYTIRHSFIITAFDVENKINSRQIKNYTNKNSPFYLTYTREDPLHPVNNKTISEAAAGIVSQSWNPYTKAKAVFDFIVDEYKLREQNSKEPDLENVVKSKKGTPWEVSVLYATMLRSLGIPAVSCSGYFVEKDRKTTPHWWTEIYLEGYGWISADPAIVMGLDFQLFNTPENLKEFYFGNIDSQHILFSKGWTEQKEMSVNSSTVKRNQAYDFQSIWEESTGNISKYSSFWTNLSITGIY